MEVQWLFVLKDRLLVTDPCLHKVFNENESFELIYMQSDGVVMEGFDEDRQ